MFNFKEKIAGIMLISAIIIFAGSFAGLSFAKIKNPADTSSVSLTPWTENIDGGGYNLSNVGDLSITNGSSTQFTVTDNTWLATAGGRVGVGTTTPEYALDVQGSIQTDTAFYGDTWSSATNNSMNMQPSGDVDDFFSFKTPSHRPTIKREGGKFIYLESSNVYDVGISARADDTYSGTLNYEKDNHMMTMLGKASPLGFKANSDYDDYIKIQTTGNIPELTVASSSALKINAGGTNSLLLNHDGGKVSVASTSPDSLFTVQGTAGTDIMNVASSTGSSIFKVVKEGYTKLGKLIVGATNTSTAGATVTVDWLDGNVQNVVLDQNTTLVFSNVQIGASLRYYVCQDATGSRTLTTPSGVHWKDATAPTLSTGGGACDILVYTTATSTATIYGSYSTGY